RSAMYRRTVLCAIPPNPAAVVRDGTVAATVVGRAVGKRVGSAIGVNPAGFGVSSTGRAVAGTRVARGVTAERGVVVARGVAVGATAGLTVARGVAVAAGLVVATTVAVAAAVAVACGVGVAAGVGVGLGVAVAVGVGDGVGCCTTATRARVARGTGVIAGTPLDAVVLVDVVVVLSLCCIAERNAPIPSPATTTPTPSAIVGSTLEDGGRDGGGGTERRRRGGSDIAQMFSAGTGRPPAVAGKSVVGMLRVAVPIDVSAVSRTASAAFALATPLRVGDLVTAAIVEALGPRAPQDKRERVVRSTLAGLASGEYVVEVDGRVYRDPDDVAVCSGTATLRFFIRRALHAA
ncbi:MAG TPA: hypothetical protein VFF00_01410, partial [Candidatus Elarobacter sp.]|nr:hypothetical protein [Candidatus Elarobacter sp.]